MRVIPQPIDHQLAIRGRHRASVRSLNNARPDRIPAAAKLQIPAFDHANELIQHSLALLRIKWCCQLKRQLKTILPEFTKPTFLAQASLHNRASPIT